MLHPFGSKEFEAPHRTSDPVGVIFRLATGLVAIFVVLTLESQLLHHVYGDAVAMLAGAVN